MNLSFPLAASTLGILLLSGCSTLAPVEEPETVNIPIACTAPQVRDAILQAASFRRFRLLSETDNAARLTYPDHPARRIKYHADFEVRYDALHYGVHFLTSQGLSEQTGCQDQPDARCAHHNVTAWMKNLSLDIYRLLPKTCQNP